MIGETQAGSSRRPGFALFATLLATGLLVPAVRPLLARPPSSQAQQPAGDVVFHGDAGFVFNYVKADKAADFEAVMASVREALHASGSMQRRQQAAGWKVFKSGEPAGSGQVLYVWVVDPVVPDADYSVPKILSEAFPTAARALYDKYAASYLKGKLVISARQLGATAAERP